MRLQSHDQTELTTTDNKVVARRMFLLPFRISIAFLFEMGNVVTHSRTACPINILGSFGRMSKVKNIRRAVKTGAGIAVQTSSMRIQHSLAEESSSNVVLPALCVGITNPQGPRDYKILPGAQVCSGRLGGGVQNQALNWEGLCGVSLFLLKPKSGRGLWMIAQKTAGRDCRLVSIHLCPSP